MGPSIRALSVPHLLLTLCAALAVMSLLFSTWSKVPVFGMTISRPQAAISMVIVTRPLACVAASKVPKRIGRHFHGFSTFVWRPLKAASRIASLAFSVESWVLIASLSCAIALLKCRSTTPRSPHLRPRRFLFLLAKMTIFLSLFHINLICSWVQVPPLLGENWLAYLIPGA